MQTHTDTHVHTQSYTITHTQTHIAHRFRALKGLSLRETVSQFSHTMTAQADLRVEAAHVARFVRDFAPVWQQVSVCFACVFCVCICVYEWKQLTLHALCVT